MNWTRRHFVYLVASSAAALGLLKFSPVLRAKLSFDDWRALPGSKLSLSLDTDEKNLTIDLIAQTENGEQTIESFPAQRLMCVEIPFVHTKNESFLLFAQARGNFRNTVRSEPVEVLADAFRFGL